MQASALASHGRAVDLLKVKSNFCKERVKCKLFKIELGDIMELIPILGQDQADNDEGVNEEWKEEIKYREIQDGDAMS